MTRMLAAIVLAIAPVAVSAASAPQAMIPHAFFHALTTHADVADDPEVFVRDGGGQLRAARATDDPATQLLARDGRSLGVTAGNWFGARGTLIVDPAQAHPAVSAAFAGLIPGGSYSLFVMTLGNEAMSPLDGSGRSGNFTADAAGRASLQLTAPSPMTHANAVVLVYHSDATAHGSDPGQLGTTAHPQLVYRIP